MKTNAILLIGRVAVLLASIFLAVPKSAHGQLVFGERTFAYDPADVIPAATEFVRQESYWEAYGPGAGGSRALMGYVFLSDDLVDIPGYSGHTINTLVGMDTEGKITGVKIVRHSEPIVLIGLNEQVIHDFIAQYVGKNIRDRIIISDTPKGGYIAVDGITSATVTAVAENVTVLEAGRLVGRTAGILQASEVRKRRPSDRFERLTWEGLAARGAIGEIVVTPGDVGQTGASPVLDLKFALLDPPAIGRNLLGERFDAIVRDRLKGGGSALFIGGTGTVSFKGAGFARGGIFDRFTLEQAGGLFVFKDIDYINFTALQAEGAPALREGGIFFLPGGGFDPAEPFTFHLTVPYRVRDRRTYGTFLADYELPPDLVEEEVPFWVTRWQSGAPAAVGFGLFLILVAVLFFYRQRLLPYRKPIHRTVAVLAAVCVGLLLKAQPSTTQILTPVNSLVNFRFPFEIFLSEPLIFLFWIAIVLSLPFWGRGFFCGWLCPYGALLELLIGLWQKVAPERLQRWVEAWQPGRAWRFGKYATFLIILGVATVNLPLAEMLDEVEPFKTFILRLARPSYFVAYFVIITLLSAAIHRFFCRFLCPLGGALAIPSRRPFLPLIRYERCTSCKICYRGCEPKAISYETGRIDYRECLQCWDCQMTARNEEVCPELIVAKREKTVPKLMIGVILIGILFSPSLSTAKTRTVNPDAGGFGEAISASADGDTIHVRAGVYFENVVIDRRLVVLGMQGAVVDAGGKGHVLVVRAPGVTVEGLTLRGSGNDPELSDAGIWVEKGASDVRLHHNRIQACRFGIWIHGSDRARAIGNRIEGIAEVSRNDRGDGIHLWAARGAVIRGNTISSSRDGIYMELSRDCRVIGNTILKSRYSVHTMWCDRSVYNGNTASENLVGLALMFSKNIEAKGNILYNNATHGILLTQVTRSHATENTVVGNTKGIFVYNSLYNTIRGNLVARNNLGMHYWGGAEDNEIEDNAFIGNEIQVKFVAARDQVWDGNFWSDYVGWDMDGDGRGDTPYLSNTLVDALLWEYPLAKMLLASPAFQVLALAEREFPVITVPKGVDHSPLMSPTMPDWASVLERYPGQPRNYYGTLAKLPHIPGERR